MIRQSIFDYLADHVRQRPDHVVYLYEDRRLTFREIDAAGARCRGALRALGVGRGDRVALLMNDGPEMIVALLGIMGLGAIAVPCCTVLKPPELAFVLGDSGACCAIVSVDQLASLEAVRHQATSLVTVLATGGARDLPPHVLDFDRTVAAATPIAPAELAADVTAFIIYTSGSTGLAKGVVHRHGDIPFTIEAMAREIYEMAPGECLFSGPRLYFGYGFSNSFSFPLGTGVTCVLVRERPTAANVAAVFKRHRPSIFLGVPANFRAFIEHRAQGQAFDTSALKFSVSAGEKLSAQLFHKWKALTGTDILDTYGTTELLHGFISNRKGRIRPGSSGQAVRGYDIRLIDDDGRMVEGAGVGTLYVRGQSALSHYWNNPEKTAETITDGWVRTGDIYRRDKDGFYFFEGRADDMFKSSGLWVSPSEIEDVLCASRAVLEAAVISEPVPTGDYVIAAFVVPRAGCDPDDRLADELLQDAGRHLPRYKRPVSIRFLPQLPRTPTGKVQRYKLKAIFKQPDSELPMAG